MLGKRHNRVKSGLALAALAVAVAACPAQAQFNNSFNPFFPTAPQMLTPLGGGVVFLGDGFGNSFGNGFSNGGGISFGNPFNGLNNGFNNGFNGFNTTNTFNSGAFNNNAFNTSTINASAVQANAGLAPIFTGVGGGFNNALNIGFRQPATSVDPFTGEIRTIDTGLFFQTNPGVSPFIVNGSVNGNNTVNTPFGGNLLATQAAFNNQFNARPRMIFRAAPAFNPSIPNPPASPYAATQIGMTAATSTNVTQPAWNGNRNPMFYRTASPIPMFNESTRQTGAMSPITGQTAVSPMFYRTASPIPMFNESTRQTGAIVPITGQSAVSPMFYRTASPIPMFNESVGVTRLGGGPVAAGSPSAQPIGNNNPMFYRTASPIPMFNESFGGQAGPRFLRPMAGGSSAVQVGPRFRFNPTMGGSGTIQAGSPIVFGGRAAK